MRTIFPIVEGHGEVDAVPLLIRKILNEELQVFDCSINSPYRIPRSKIAQFDADLIKAIKLGELKLNGHDGGVLILADADDDCPVEMNRRFIDFCEINNFRFPVAFVLANREYEAWLISCGASMRAHASVRDDAPSHDNPEAIRGAKGFFSREILKDGIAYSETVDQAKFTSQIDVSIVIEKCRSFRKLIKEIERLTAPNRGR